MEQEEKLCSEVETVRELRYLDDMVSTVGGCEAPVSDRTRYWRVKLKECVELLYASRFHLMLVGIVYMRGFRPTILCWSGVWLL